MSEHSPQSKPEPGHSSDPVAQPNRWPFDRIAKYAAGGIVGIIVAIFLLGLILAVATNVEATAPRVQIIRDIFIIILALQGILIVTALAILILQIARLINLIQNEVMPILKNTQDTVNTARGTVEFVGSNLTEPIVRAGGFSAGLMVFVRELGGIRRAIRKEHVNGKQPE